MRHHRWLRVRSAARALVVTAVIGSTVTACGDPSSSLCERSVSVSGYIVELSQGLDNRAESEYTQFRFDSMDAYDMVSGLASGQGEADDATRAAAMIVRDNLGALASALDDVTWDLSRAALDPSILEKWRAVITPEMLAHANVVEAWIISRCGLPSMVTSSGDGPDRLPDPSIPSPTATDPPTSPPDDVSEQEALGSVVATLFSLTLTPSQVVCLGRELSGVVDSGAAGENPAQYHAQFQTAFDDCGIEFTVPEG